MGWDAWRRSATRRAWQNRSCPCWMIPGNFEAIVPRSRANMIRIPSRRSTRDCLSSCDPDDRICSLRPTQMKDFLFLQLSELPYFRAFLRSVESSYYQELPLPTPTYDVGCGDGHFASLTFEQKIDIGLDPWHGPIHEAGRRKAYGALVEADAARSPFPDHYFASAFSNSVLEHIPHIDAVPVATSRVLKPGAPFYF